MHEFTGTDDCCDRTGLDTKRATDALRLTDDDSGRQQR